MDLLTAMKVYVRVVEAANFTRAAERLSMPKATVTGLIKGLEAHLQTKLLNRTTRRVLVTTDGAAYFERAVRILSEVDDLDATFRKSKERPAGRVRVEMAGVFSDSLIFPALKTFQLAYPDIALDISVSDRSVDYLAENVDCALRAGTPSDRSLVVRQVSEIASLNCASPGYLAEHGIPVRPEELQTGHKIIGYLKAQNGQTMPFRFQKDAERFEIEPPFNLTVSDTRSSVAAAISGLGIVQIPDFAAREAIQRGELIAILEDWTRDRLPVFVVYPPNRHLSNKVRVFVDWLIRHLAETKRALAER